MTTLNEEVLQMSEEKFQQISNARLEELKDDNELSAGAQIRILNEQHRRFRDITRESHVRVTCIEKLFISIRW